MEIKINVHKRIGFFWKARKGLGNPALVVFNGRKLREGSPNRLLRAIEGSRKGNIFSGKEFGV
jgi:hypothetical protein